MIRRSSFAALLVSLALAAVQSASAQWPTDEQLDGQPATNTPHIAQGTVVNPPELLAPEALGIPEELFEAEESDTWILPNYWFNRVDWDGGVEIGISGTDGNSQSTSFRAGVKLKRKTDSHETTFDLTYLRASADGHESQHNAVQNFGYERKFGESRWSFFAKEFAEYDEFKAFDIRIALNAGLGYKFIDTETTKLKGRYGAGASHEIGGPDDAWVPELVYGADFERQLTKRQKLGFTIDYFPEWGNFDNYRVVSDLGWEVLLDAEHHLNLKLSVNDRYDSTPNGRKPNDINYALLLLWKM